MAPGVPTSPTPAVRTPRPWSAPRLAELPKLTKLTLASEIGGGGGTGGGGSTVFALFLALVGLSGCFADRGMAPSEGTVPKVVASVPCVASIATQTVRCGGPLGAPGQEILGGQGVRVVLRSSNVVYNSGTERFTFDVTVQNLSTQSIGTNGSSPTGLKVFFFQEPVATAGYGTIAIENATFGTVTAADQYYYSYADSLGHQEISAPTQWQFLVPITVTTFSFSVLVAADVGDAGGILQWQAIPAFRSMQPFDVAASGEFDAIVVGNYGRSLRWDGTAWTAMATTTSRALNAAAALAPGEYLAADDYGGIWRSKGMIWTKVHQRLDSRPFTRIWVRDSTHFVAGGIGGEWGADFDADGTIEYGDPLPDGDLTLRGRSFYYEEPDGRNLSFTITTPTVLAYDASCAAVDDDPPFTAGVLLGKLNGSNSQASFEVTFTGCGTYTVAVDNANDPAAVAAR